MGMAVKSELLITPYRNSELDLEKVEQLAAQAHNSL